MQNDSPEQLRGQWTLSLTCPLSGCPMACLFQCGEWEVFPTQWESVETGQVCPDVQFEGHAPEVVCGLMLWREVTLVLRVTKDLPLACRTDRMTHSTFPKNASLTILKCFSDTVLDGFPNNLTPLQKYLCLIDVGYFINTSGAALFKPERNVDVIISLDYGLGQVFKVRRLPYSATCRVKLILLKLLSK